ncbi:copper resistance CopC family protein [Marinicella pacifica]|nr:copper resistance CopC family protein [Marinicella pacifica]
MSSLVMAHSDLDQSSPANGQTVNKPLNEIVLTFTQPVKLVQFELVSSDQQTVDTNFKPTLEDKTEFVIKLNSLDEDDYTVLWTIMGGDGHKSEGDFSFTLKQSKHSNHSNHH